MYCVIHTRKLFMYSYTVLFIYEISPFIDIQSCSYSAVYEQVKIIYIRRLCVHGVCMFFFLTYGGCSLPPDSINVRVLFVYGGYSCKGVINKPPNNPLINQKI